ncbi:hypothetical protein [Brucella endophytica]|uniref:hypothetical protein n=1 Tax=Brucella endophytica TaxID=1963359 RepID=UPI00166A9FCC|nr:hypothetical protein [Brucella endophytica]
MPGLGAMNLAHVSVDGYVSKACLAEQGRNRFRLHHRKNAPGKECCDGSHLLSRQLRLLDLLKAQTLCQIDEFLNKPFERRLVDEIAIDSANAASGFAMTAGVGVRTTQYLRWFACFAAQCVPNRTMDAAHKSRCGP